ncbi:MAG TPA: hypothetical protein VG826_19535 [Pirellulales bacterium]|nr:hypothetical protein [Pirellulales bacterium]
MSERSKTLCFHRLRFGTIAVLMGVAGAIVLANSASEQLTFEYVDETAFKGKPAELAYGWPLNWYWRERIADPGSRWPVTSHWPVSRCRESALLADAAVWVVLLVAGAAGSHLLLRRYQPPIRWHPRAAVAVPLTLVAACTVLANLSFEEAGPSRFRDYFNYGWPLIWYRRVDIFIPIGPGAHVQEWDYSAAGLAGNLVLWILLLATTILVWEWFARRYRPRLRWSLRAMLIGVAVVAGVCAWFVVARDRANNQDAFVESLRLYEDGIPEDWSGIDEDEVYVERRAPKWLSVVGADRFCRHIVGLRFATLYCNDDAEHNREVFQRLARLPSLRFLEIEPDTAPNRPREFSSDMAAILGEMRQLRMLNLKCQGDYFHATLDDYQQSTLNAAHYYLVAIGKLTNLKRLRLSLWTRSTRDLACLAELTELKTLTLDIGPVGMHIYPWSKVSEPDTATGVLAHLPVLPRLEELDLHNSSVGDEDLGRLSGFKRLKSLNLSMTRVTDTGLAKLAPLTSLEEIAMDQRMATAVGFEALAGLERLRSVHIKYVGYEEPPSRVLVPLDDGGQLDVLPDELDGLRHALKTLRQAHPGIVINENYDEFEKRGDWEVP